MQTFDYICRKATPADSAAMIAKLIHLTDPYIYPTICKDPCDPVWIDLIGECLKAPDNIFNIENISVVLFKDRIVGIACVIPCGKPLKFIENIHLPESVRHKLQPSIAGYFTPLIAESMEFAGYNITNICVDKQHRGNGVGALLMSYCLATYGTKPIHLDVVAANEAAIHLYKRMGFFIENEYLGFSGNEIDLACYHMLYLPQNAAQ